MTNFEVSYGLQVWTNTPAWTNTLAYNRVRTLRFRNVFTVQAPGPMLPPVRTNWKLIYPVPPFSSSIWWWTTTAAATSWPYWASSRTDCRRTWPGSTSSRWSWPSTPSTGSDMFTATSNPTTSSSTPTDTSGGTFSPVRGARYLTGENLEVVCTEFSTLSYAFFALLQNKSTAHVQPLQSWKLGPGLVLSAKVCPCLV